MLKAYSYFLTGIGSMRLLALLVLVLSALPASAKTVTGTIQPTFVSSGVIQPVRFALSGLVEGDNDGSQVVLTLVESPFAQTLGDYPFLFAGDPGNQPAFTVKNGSISFAFAAFERDTIRVFLGTPDTWLNEIFDSATGDSLFSTEPLNFTAAVPEPASWAMLVIGFALVGGVMRRRGVRPA
jgi:hypothetical protein